MLSMAYAWLLVLTHYAANAPTLLQLRAWAKLALEECGPQFHGIDVAAFPQEVDRLEARLRPLQSPVCLCHNDLNHMNILRLDEVHTRRAGT